MFKIVKVDQYRFWQDVLANAKAELAACVECAFECETCKRWSYEAPLTFISAMPEYYLIRCSGCGTYKEWDKHVIEARGLSFAPSA